MDGHLGTHEDTAFDLEEVDVQDRAVQPVELAILDQAIEGIGADVQLDDGTFGNAFDCLLEVLLVQDERVALPWRL